MLHKILITFIVLTLSITMALTLNIFDAPTVEAEKTEESPKSPQNRQLSHWLLS